MSLIFVSKATVWSVVTLGEEGLRKLQRGRKDWAGTEKRRVWGSIEREEGLDRHKEEGGAWGESQRGRRIYGTKREESLGAQSGRRVWEEYSKGGGPGGREGGGAGEVQKRKEGLGSTKREVSGEHREGGRV